MRTQEIFEANYDYVLEKFEQTMKRNGEQIVMMSKEQLIGMFNTAALLTVAHTIETKEN